MDLLQAIMYWLPESTHTDVAVVPLIQGQIQ